MIKWDEVTDVIVVGSGFAGLSAAIEAKNGGKSVIVLEKMYAPGGNSIISDGGVAAPETRLQKRYNIEDSPENMYKDMLDAGLGLNNPDLLEVLTENARETFDWTIDYLGVEYIDKVDLFSGHTTPRCYLAKDISGRTIIKRQLEKIHELGIEVRLKSKFEEFILDEDKSVIGVKIREDYNYKASEEGIEKYIKAESGVVLATGGFSSDINFRSILDPRLTEEIDTTNKPFATAQGLKEALKIRAMPVQLSHIQLAPWTSPDEKGFGDGPEFAEYILFTSGIVVDNKTGQRFINELTDRKTFSDKILSIGYPCVGIADSKAVKESGWNIDKSLKKSVVKEFSTIDEFAGFYNIPLDSFEKSIYRYNEFVKNGEDPDFGKRITGKAFEIIHPPYYGIRLWPKVHYTMGGIGINKEGEVLNYDGEVIKGLYAAGEVTGGIHGASRLANCAITDCLVFGRIVGKNVGSK